MSGMEEHEPHVWIFQANPERYRIEESLQQEQEELWNLNQHASAVFPGDRVLIWLCGNEAGIYAVGTVLTQPEVRPDTVRGIGYWHDPGEGKRAKARVRVRYDRVLLDRPLRKAFLETDPALRDLSVLRSPRGTNFPVTQAEWTAIQMWLD